MALRLEKAGRSTAESCLRNQLTHGRSAPNGMPAEQAPGRPCRIGYRAECEPEKPAERRERVVAPASVLGCSDRPHRQDPGGTRRAFRPRRRSARPALRPAKRRGGRSSPSSAAKRDCRGPPGRPASAPRTKKSGRIVKPGATNVPTEKSGALPRIPRETEIALPMRQAPRSRRAIRTVSPIPRGRRHRRLSVRRTPWRGPPPSRRRATPGKGFDDDHPAAATRAAAARRSCFGFAVRLCARAVGRGQQMTSALDVVG